MGARSQSKALASIEDIRKGFPEADVHFLEIDLSHLESVVKAAQDFSEKETALHGLVNNAGIMGVPFFVTDNGFESQFQVGGLASTLQRRAC